MNAALSRTTLGLSYACPANADQPQAFAPEPPRTKKSKASCGCVSGAAPSPTVLKTVKKDGRHEERDTRVATSEFWRFLPVLQQPVEELTCPGGNPAEKRHHSAIEKRKQRSSDHDEIPRAARPPPRLARRSLSRTGRLVARAALKSAIALQSSGNTVHDQRRGEGRERSFV